MGENKVIYAEKTLKTKEEYLLNGTYSIEITSLGTVELRKERKRRLREIIKNDQRNNQNLKE